MITLFSSQQQLSVPEMSVALRKQIEGLPRMVSAVGDMDKILRFEYKIASLDLLNWLHNQKTKARLYYSSRDGDQEVAGVGMADCIVSTQEYSVVLEKIEERLSKDNPHLRYYGGFSFSKDSLDEKWDAFGLSRFMVPQFELLREGAQYYFSFHINVKDVTEENIQKVLVDFDALDFSEATSYRKVPEIIHREDQPAREEWERMVDVSLKSAVAKTVLARQSKFQFDLKIRPSALIKFLKEETPNCFHFCMQLDDHSGFVSATPERLFALEEGRLQSEAVAGTAQRESDLKNAKHALEHRYVVDMLKEKFTHLCEAYSIQEGPSTLKVKEATHLYAAFEGKLKEGQTPADVLRALHPTPAVGGFPKEASLEQIKDLEPFSRGWYAAPVGYVGFDACEFLVGIRSGLIHDGDLYLYAGAGIVDGSVAQDEWNEIEQKISRFMKVFSSNE